MMFQNTVNFNLHWIHHDDDHQTIQSRWVVVI